MRAVTGRVVLAASVLAASAVLAQTAAPDSGPGASHRQQLPLQDFSAQALYDLGNSWLQSGHPGRAILQYERALVLAPEQPALERALAQARERAGVNVATPSAWELLTGIVSDDTWAWCTALSLLVLCAALARLAFGKGGGGSKALALAGACSAVLAGDVIALHWRDLDRAVVLQGAIAARIAPAAAAEASFELHEGELLYLEDRFQDYERVRTEDGRGGWVRRDAVAPVRVDLAQAQTEELPP